MTDNRVTWTGVMGKGFFGRLASGDFGLAKTYWIYGVLVGFILNMLLGLINSVGVLKVLILFFVVYQLMVIIGIWKAASKYQGLILWSVLAKISAILGMIALVFILYGLFG